jgi:ABC-2 type transport system ATP-binding protein
LWQGSAGRRKVNSGIDGIVDDDDIVIRTEALTRDFRTVRAVDGLSIEVRAGTIFGFLGPNGSGKTTTIRMLLGLLEPTSGKAEVFGFDVGTSADQVRMRCGAVVDYHGLYERLSGEENLELFARIWRLSAAERRTRIHNLLQAFGLWERRTELCGTWSHGMKQKLAVARAMLHRPSLLFLDEPTAGLDPVISASLRDELAELAARDGVTIFLTTHNLPEAEQLCSRVAVIRAGKLLAVGHPDELRAQRGGRRADIVGRGLTADVAGMLRSRPEIQSVTLESGRLVVEFRGPSDMAPLVPLLVGAGVEIQEVRRETRSLEEAFLTLVEEEDRS